MSVPPKGTCYGALFCEGKLEWKIELNLLTIRNQRQHLKFSVTELADAKKFQPIIFCSTTTFDWETANGLR